MNRSAAQGLFAGLAVATLAAAVAGPVAAQRQRRPPSSTRSASPIQAASATAGARRCSARPRPRRSRVRPGERGQDHQSQRPTPDGQLEDIRNLISAGVDAILVNPSSPEALNAAIKEATDKKHRRHRHRRSSDGAHGLQPLQRPGELRLPGRQVAVRPVGQQGQRHVHARRVGPPGRHRPRRRLQAGPGRGRGRHQGRQRGPDQLGPGNGDRSDRPPS